MKLPKLAHYESASRAMRYAAVYAPILSFLAFAAGIVLAVSASAAVLTGDIEGASAGSALAMIVLGVGVVASVVFGFAFARWGTRYDSASLHRTSGSLLTSAIFQVAILVFSYIGVLL